MINRLRECKQEYNLQIVTEDYAIRVKNHLKLSGSNIIDNLAYYCELGNGRISYEDMNKVLGKHYPRAPWVPAANSKEGIITFLKCAGLYFNHDDEFVYFP